MPERAFSLDSHANFGKQFAGKTDERIIINGQPSLLSQITPFINQSGIMITPADEGRK